MATFALVHGAGHGAWCWERLIPRLETLGHRALAMDLPCEDRAAGATRYAEVVDRAIGPASDLVVVGHSLGGLTIPLVADRRPVRRLVYLCALVPEPGRSRPPLDIAYVAPRTSLEEMLADAWAEALEVDQVGVDDDFLDLGGHSLAATRLLFRLTERLGVDVPFANLFETATVAAQARAIVEILAGKLSDPERERLLGRIETG